MKHIFKLLGIIPVSIWIGFGCGDGSKNPPSNLTIAFSPAAPATVTAGLSVNLSAAVTNDPTNGGVDWSCTPSAACGSFNPSHTSSGGTTVFTAPTTAGTVTILAAAHTNTTITASFTITVTAAPAITVTLSPAPPANLGVNATTTIAATVTNDSANAGVDWSCTPAGSCGTFNPSHTASGTTTTYTAPSTAGNVTILATSTSATNVTSGPANITITTGPAPGLAGTFVFSVSGTDLTSRVYSLAGAVTVDANGNVTGGEQDFNDGTSANKSPVGGDQITGGSYTLDSMGRGILTLKTNNANLGAAGTETFSIVRINSKHLLIEQFDASATSRGSMDLQSPLVSGLPALSGPYAFTIVGKLGTTTEDFGGTITFSGNGTLSDSIDINEGGTISHGSSNGTYTAQDTFGRGTIAFGGNTFVYYSVLADATRTKAFRLLVTNPNETDIGSAFAQASGATFNPSMINGKYVFVETGNHGNSQGFVTAGQFSADGTGVVTSGAADESEGGTPDAQTIGGITGTYTLSANGIGTLTLAWSNDSHKRGMYPVDPAINLLDPNSTSGSNGALLLSIDSHVGDGVLVQQGQINPLSGNFGLVLHAFTNAGETDEIGQVGISGTNFSGIVDVNDLFHVTGQASAATISGTLTPDSANSGRITMPLTLTVSGTLSTQTIVIYQISDDQLAFVQTDAAQFASGILEKQQ